MQEDSLPAKPKGKPTNTEVGREFGRKYSSLNPNHEGLLNRNLNQKKAGTAILILDRIDFKDYYKRQGRTLHNV